MRLRARVVLAIAFASLVPLGMLGMGAATLAYERVRDKELKLLHGMGQGMSLFVETWLKAQESQLDQQAGIIELGTLSEEGRETYLRLIYGQLPEARIVTIYEMESGEIVGEFPAHEAGGSRAEPGDSVRIREHIAESRREQFHDSLPLDAVAKAWEERPDPTVGFSPAVGAPYRPEGRSSPVIPAVVVLPEANHTFLLGVELSLDGLEESFERQGEDGPVLALLDQDGAFMLGSDEEGLLDQTAIGAFLDSESEILYTSSKNGDEVIARTQPVAGPGWTVVVASPARLIEAAAVEIRYATAYLAGLAGLLCLLVGANLAKQLSGPVVRLKDAAMAVAEGDLGRKVEVTGSDEITELTRTFNFMSHKLQEDADKIRAQQSEIEAFNRELQDRVEERTRELEEAHDQLLQSARLAAVGEMGAGLAHELNNPIAGILGMTQLLMAKESASGSSMLQAVESQALRCKEIVGTLLGFSNELSSDQLNMGAVERVPLDLADLTREVLVLVSAPLAQRGVRVIPEVEGGLEIVGDKVELGQAIAQLFTSICSTAPRGGTLTVKGFRDNGVIEVHFKMEGPEIRLGSDDWKASGLGFWAARRVLASHKAVLERVEDEGALELKDARWLIRFEGA